MQHSSGPSATSPALPPPMAPAGPPAPPTGHGWGTPTTPGDPLAPPPPPPGWAEPPRWTGGPPPRPAGAPAPRARPRPAPPPRHRRGGGHRPRGRRPRRRQQRPRGRRRSDRGPRPRRRPTAPGPLGSGPGPFRAAPDRLPRRAGERVAGCLQPGGRWPPAGRRHHVQPQRFAVRHHDHPGAGPRGGRPPECSVRPRRARSRDARGLGRQQPADRADRARRPGLRARARHRDAAARQRRCRVRRPPHPRARRRSAGRPPRPRCGARPRGGVRDRRGRVRHGRPGRPGALRQAGDRHHAHAHRVVLGLFVVAQLLALTSAGQRLVQQSGLTPAEYARSSSSSCAGPSA